MVAPRQIPDPGYFRASPPEYIGLFRNVPSVPIGSIISPIRLWSNASVEESRRPCRHGFARDRGDGKEILHPLNRTSQRKDTRGDRQETQAAEDPRSRIPLRILGN